MPTAIKELTTQVPLQLANKIEHLALQQQRSNSWVMQQALTAWVAQEEQKDQLTQEALAEVDAGLVTSHQEILNWAASSL